METSPVVAKQLMEDAVEIARGAGAVTLEWFGGNALAVETKADGSPVTAADKAAERYIREQVDRVAPSSGFVGEEEGSAPGTSGLTWYIDPIDGTVGFARGVPLYATLLAVNDAFGPAIGVIHIPATGETVWAGRGLGAWNADGPISVSKTSSMDKVLVTTSSVRRWGTPVYDRVVATGAKIMGWGDGYGWLMVASGRADAMVDLHGGCPWDFAPVPVIMSEAGGKFTALDGTESIETSCGVASNGLVHDVLLQLING